MTNETGLQFEQKEEKPKEGDFMYVSSAELFKELGMPPAEAEKCEREVEAIVRRGEMKRRALHVTELSDEQVEAIRNAKMPPDLDYLNAELGPMDLQKALSRARDEAFKEAADYVSSQAQMAGEFGRGDNADELSWIAAQIRSRIGREGK